MILLALGVALWSAAHLFKRIAPGRRAALGDAGKGIVAACLAVSLVLMVLGYRSSPEITLWQPPLFLRHLNNLLMLVALYLFACAGKGVWVDRKIRHSMLSGTKAWAVAHLLVNGDLASLILFGGLLAWAVVEVILINRAQRSWTPPQPASGGQEVGILVTTAVMLAVAAWVHNWLGYYPF